VRCLLMILCLVFIATPVGGVSYGVAADDALQIGGMKSGDVNKTGSDQTEGAEEEKNLFKGTWEPGSASIGYLERIIITDNQITYYKDKELWDIERYKVIKRFSPTMQLVYIETLMHEGATFTARDFMVWDVYGSTADYIVLRNRSCRIRPPYLNPFAHGKEEVWENVQQITEKYLLESEANGWDKPACYAKKQGDTYVFPYRSGSSYVIAKPTSRKLY